MSKSTRPNRRTFAIISHPDAGKTTLTEKLLLFGGAIQAAGEVKARGQNRRARSDWMKIEQQRGISVTSSVMTFERDDITFNLLDTPGHEDFSEDTYRTLTAVDSAVMVIDAARGIEAQTRKLFEVCRLRSVPIITFVNKVDREGRDPFSLMDEVADQLQLDVTPMNWPIGMGGIHEGLYDFGPIPNHISADAKARLIEESELARGGYSEFDLERYQAGDLTPVYFGSALRDAGVETLIDALARYAPSPRPQPAEPKPVSPDDPLMNGFIFKVQANMNPMHRDRIAFMRVCSGKFRRGMKLNQVGTGKSLSVHSPILFFARDRELAEEAYPGDIIGIPNHGTLRVGDTLTEGAPDITITGLPNFAPEILRRVVLKDPTKTKQLRKALGDLAEEGITQVFFPSIGSQWIVGVVGQLQLEVLISRLEAEYKVDAALEPSPWDTARWISSADPAAMRAFAEQHRTSIATDRDDAPVFMAKDSWDLNYVMSRHEGLKFSATKERA
jgi:peptide chain release factor 3